jgi:hypothetical protein
MADSYLGLITRRGLELLVRETEHAERFLQRRLQRGQWTGAIGCWAVLSDDAAERVRRLVLCAWYREALELLNAEALSLGTLLPEPIEDELSIHR